VDRFLALSGPIERTVLRKLEHPFTQPLSPILRLAGTEHECKQSANQPNPNQQQVKSSLLHGPNNMPSSVPEASRKGLLECRRLAAAFRDR